MQLFTTARSGADDEVLRVLTCKTSSKTGDFDLAAYLIGVFAVHGLWLLMAVFVAEVLSVRYGEFLTFAFTNRSSAAPLRLSH